MSGYSSLLPRWSRGFWASGWSAKPLTYLETHSTPRERNASPSPALMAWKAIRLVRRQTAAADQVIERRGVELRDLLHHPGCDVSREIVGPHLDQRPLIGAANRRATISNDHRIRHGAGFRLARSVAVHVHTDRGSARKRANLHQVAQLVGQPQATPSVLVGRRSTPVGERILEVMRRLVKRNEPGGAPAPGIRRRHAGRVPKSARARDPFLG